MVCSASNTLTVNQEQFHRVIGLLKDEETNKERLEYIHRFRFCYKKWYFRIYIRNQKMVRSIYR